MYFLWTTVFVEIIGSYAPLAYYTDYRYFAFIENTRFAHNTWLYNAFTILNFLFFTFYFSSHIRNTVIRKLFYWLIGIFIGVSVIYFSISDALFTNIENINYLFGALLLLSSILVFYYYIINSELILKLKYFLPLYISIGVMVFNLTVTPIEQLAKFLTPNEGNELFLTLYKNVLIFANLLLYLSFIIGFVVCSKKKRY